MSQSFSEIKNIKTALSENLFIARKCADLNHERLVDVSGVTRPVISGIENGYANPTLDTLCKLAECLGINIDLLLLSKMKFELLLNLFRNEFNRSKLSGYEILIPEEIWKNLMVYSAKKEKKDYARIAKNCRSLIMLNFPDMSSDSLNRAVYLSVQGYLFQNDGFVNGIEFGIWLSMKLFQVK